MSSNLDPAAEPSRDEVAPSPSIATAWTLPKPLSKLPQVTMKTALVREVKVIKLLDFRFYLEQIEKYKNMNCFYITQFKIMMSYLEVLIRNNDLKLELI